MPVCVRHRHAHQAAADYFCDVSAVGRDSEQSAGQVPVNCRVRIEHSQPTSRKARRLYAQLPCCCVSGTVRQSSARLTTRPEETRRSSTSAACSEDGPISVVWDSAASGIGQLAYAISADEIRANFSYDNAERTIGIASTAKACGREVRASDSCAEPSSTDSVQLLTALGT